MAFGYYLIIHLTGRLMRSSLHASWGKLKWQLSLWRRGGAVEMRIRMHIFGNASVAIASDSTSRWRG